MLVNKSDTVNVTLSINKNDDFYTFCLEGLAKTQIKTKSIKEISEHSKRIKRIFIGFFGYNNTGKRQLKIEDLKELELPKTINDIPSQHNKIKLNAIGSFIYKKLIPQELSTILKNHKIKSLSLDIDDSLLGIPWELMNDGKEFFCIKYSLGRKIPLEVKKSTSFTTKKEAKFLLISDPAGSLPGSKNEINYLTSRLLNFPRVKINIKGFQLRKKEFLDTINNENIDILHFSGHGFYDKKVPKNSYLTFYDYKNPCYAHEIAEKIKEKPPSLIVANACTSAQSFTGLQGLAHAFLSSGTSAYIGTIWPVDDRLAGMLGEEFYRYLIFGKTVGESLRLARLNCRNKFGWSVLDWAAYTLYGNPNINFFN